MRRHVRTLRHVAHVAQIAIVDDVPVDLLVDPIQLQGRRLVDRIEQSWKRVAETEAAATAVTDVENPLELLVERSLVIEGGVAPVERVTDGCFETPLASSFGALWRGGVLRNGSGCAHGGASSTPTLVFTGTQQRSGRWLR